MPKVALSPAAQQRLDAAAARCHGHPVFRARKLTEARRLFQLSELAPPGRMVITTCDLVQTLRVSFQLDVPVPCLDEHGGFHIHRGAWLGLQYFEEALSQPLPGYAFVSVLLPARVHLANCGGSNLPGQPLCLGATLPIGVRCTEIVLMSYAALSMQTVMFDEFDAAGVLNPEAARWWQQHTHLIPLSRMPFLGSEESTTSKSQAKG